MGQEKGKKEKKKKRSQVKTSFEVPRQTYQLKTSLRRLVGLEEKREKNKRNPCSMYIFDECMYSLAFASNKNKLVPKGKFFKPSQKKSNFDFLLLFSNAPTRPRPCQSITLIYFHHTHHSQASTIQFAYCPRKLQNALCYYRIQNTQSRNLFFP